MQVAEILSQQQPEAIPQGRAKLLSNMKPAQLHNMKFQRTIRSLVTLTTLLVLLEPSQQQLANAKPTSECALRPNPCKNGATCIPKADGSFECSCINGWTGPTCEENVDDCVNNPCLNNGTCIDKTGTFQCLCPPGKTGLFCQFDDGCYSSPCKNNASCTSAPMDGKAICICQHGFSGDDCSIDDDECAAGSPCEFGGVCVNEPGGFRCDCAKGFEGPRCEINIDECQNNPCQNGAACLDLPGNYSCVCPAGFAGPECQRNVDECASNPCQNGGICKDEINAFRCLCPQGYWGVRCELNASHSRPLSRAEQPWINCPYPIECMHAFFNQKCDPACNNADCLYDGNDCRTRIPPNDSEFPSPATNQKRACDDTYCIKNYANGVCDEECNSEECIWDGLDCGPDENETKAQGLLVISVQPALKLGDEGQARIDLNTMLRKISHVTKTVLKLHRHSLVDDGKATEIELIADNRRCQTSCYNSTELMAKFLGALKSKSKNRSGLDNTVEPSLWTNIKSVDSVMGDLAKPSDSFNTTTLWGIVAGSVVIVCAVLMVISVNGSGPKKEKAVTWFPEGFAKNVVKTSRNRDPTDRKPRVGGGRGVSTLQALGGNFFRGLKRNERNISTNPNGLYSTDIDRCNAATPNGGGIYHEPYDYDQYGSTYNGTDTMVGHLQDQPMTPSSMSMNPINMEGPNGMTPLMVASMSQQFSKETGLGLVAYGTTSEVDASGENNVTDLLNRGAQVSLTNKGGETALHLAARHGRADNASRLLAHCDSKDINAKDSKGRTPLHHAIAGDHLGVFELLIRNRGTDLNAQTDDGTTPLILAAKKGNYSMLEELIQNECEVTKSDLSGKTALHWAAAVNNGDIIRRLLSVRETNKDAQDLLEETPLFLAAREGARTAVEILLAHNANKDIKDQLDKSPMDIAREKRHDDILRLLEDHEPQTPRSISTPRSASTPRSVSTPKSVSSPKPVFRSQTHIYGASEPYNVPPYLNQPCLKNLMTPSPESPFSPPGGYAYQNLTHSQPMLQGKKMEAAFI